MAPPASAFAAPPVQALALRPLELKQFFDFALRLYRLNFVPVVLLTALLQAPVSAIGTVAAYRFLGVVTEIQKAQGTGMENSPEQAFLQDTGTWLMLGGLSLLALVYQLLMLPLVHVALSRLAACTLLGERCDARAALAYARQRYWATQVALATFLLPLLLLSVLLLLPVLALSAGGADAGTAISAASAVLLITLGLLGTWLFYFRYFAAISGALQAVEAPPVQGATAQGLWYLKRSYGLTAHYFWRVLGLSFLFHIAVGVIQNGLYKSINLVVWLIWLAFNWPQNSDAAALIQSSNNPTVMAVTLVFSALFSLLFPGLLICYQVLLYYDLRFRREGLDLQLLLDRSAPPRSQPQHSPA